MDHYDPSLFAGLSSVALRRMQKSNHKINLVTPMVKEIPKPVYMAPPEIQNFQPILERRTNWVREGPQILSGVDPTIRKNIDRLLSATEDDSDDFANFFDSIHLNQPFPPNDFQSPPNKRIKTSTRVNFSFLASTFSEANKQSETLTTEALFEASLTAETLFGEPSETSFNDTEFTDISNISIGFEAQNGAEINETSSSEFEFTMPEICRIPNSREDSIGQNDVFTVNTFYEDNHGMEPNQNEIEDDYKSLLNTDWNAVAEEMNNMMSLENIRRKINIPNITLGDRSQQVCLNDNLEDLSYGVIQESLEEIEKSFEDPSEGLVTSTPKRRFRRHQNVPIRNQTKNLDQSQKTSQTHSDSINKPFGQESFWNIDLPQTEYNEEEEEIRDSLKKKTCASATSVANSDDEITDVSFANYLLELRRAGGVELCKTQDSNESIVSAERKTFIGFSLPQQLSLNDFDPELIKDARRLEFLEEDFTCPKYDERRKEILTIIENTFQKLLEAVVQGKTASLKIPHTRKWEDCTLKDKILTPKKNEAQMKTVSFGTSSSRRSFTVLVVTLSDIYKNLARNQSITKRELFYRDVELYVNQECVNNALDSICAILHTQEYELGVLTSSKGLIAGELIICFDEEKIDCTCPCPVPQNPSEIRSLESNADYVLIVEKDTVFQRLINGNIFARLSKKIILITAKGYPDINTRMVLKRISDDLKKPIYIIVDADPYGIEIALTYKHGSLQKINNSKYLAVPKIEWIGIHPSDVESLDITRVRLTKSDMKKVDELLKRPYVDHFLESELKCLKQRKLKAEIESLYHSSIDFLINDYIPRKIRSIEKSIQ